MLVSPLDVSESKGLEESIWTKQARMVAFAELLAEDFDDVDEPASALLERIRAGRVESSKKTVARNVPRKRGER